MRIQSPAVRRCGEQLGEFRSAAGRLAKTAGGDVTSLPASIKEAAADAGMSGRQRVTAIRIARVQAAHFEAAVESDEPPTVTNLADKGRKTSAPANAAAPASFQDQIELIGTMPA